MKTTNGKFFLNSLFIATMTVCFAWDTASGASNIIENKSSTFESAINADLGFEEGGSLNDSALADQIRKQRAAAEARDSLNMVAANQKSGLKNGKNACDSGLRECMQKTCGKDFTKCALDGDTDFGDKLNKCKRDLNCTGHEFQLFTAEIKADRDFNARMSSYQSVIDCGNNYNACIQKECGATFGKCLGKAAADKAVNKCATIAKNCMEQDSGLSARFGSVIGRLREDAEKDVKADEERMYTLRDLMSEQCQRLGAMFDERSFDCVFTVNFFAGEKQDKPMASRKRYAGDTFVCTQEWFGTDVTTFKENAYRETRAQTAASSAMLGSGVGTAAGLITSGAMQRSIDAAKAKKAEKAEKAEEAEEDEYEEAEEAEEEEQAAKAGKKAGKAAAKAEKKAEKAEKKAEKQAAKADKKAEKADKKAEKKAAKAEKKAEKQAEKAEKKALKDAEKATKKVEKTTEKAEKARENYEQDPRNKKNEKKAAKAVKEEVSAKADSAKKDSELLKTVNNNKDSRFIETKLQPTKIQPTTSNVGKTDDKK